MCNYPPWSNFLFSKTGSPLHWVPMRGRGVPGRCGTDEPERDRNFCLSLFTQLWPLLPIYVEEKFVDSPTCACVHTCLLSCIHISGRRSSFQDPGRKEMSRRAEREKSWPELVVSSSQSGPQSELVISSSHCLSVSCQASPSADRCLQPVFPQNKMNIVPE